MYETVGIVGLGLLGGSLAKAFKNRVGSKKIVASNRNEDVLSLALSENVIDVGTTKIDESFSDCDIVFICTPVDTIFPFAKELTKFVKKGCIITDVGSTKGTIYENMKALGEEILFIGGHPMTGSEKFRYQASKEHIFENAYYIVAPAENVPQNEVERFKKALELIGSLPVEISPKEHDYVVAAISHVPHIIASCLVNNVKALDKNNHMRLLAAGGFKDITRIASSSPEMWQSICLENRDEILKVLSYYEQTLREFKSLISSNDKSGLYDTLAGAKDFRDSFSDASPGLIAKRYDIVVDVLDRPGSIAVIAVLLSSNGINIKNIGIVNSREQENAPLFISFSTEEERTKSVQLLEDHNYQVQIKI